MQVYLCGPMDFATDRGIGWREEVTQKLLDLGFSSNDILNPCAKREILTHPHMYTDEADLIKTYREEKNWAALEKIVKDIVHIDLRMVDKSDVVIVNLPKIGHEPHRHINENFVNALKDCDIPIALLDSFYDLYDYIAAINVPTFGTMHEIVVARQQKKPVLLISEDGLEKLSSWLMWLVGHNNVFTNIDGCVNYLDQIINNKIQPNCEDWMIMQ